MTQGRACLAHPDHLVPVPIEIHHVRPVARGGQDSITVTLCANAHGAVHALLDEIEARAVTSPYATVHEVIRALPREVWAGFEGRIRYIAYKGWQQYGLGFLNGRYAAHHRLWNTAGEARAHDVPEFRDIRHAARWSRRWRRELERL
jgi:hypothetical protein